MKIRKAYSDLESADCGGHRRLLGPLGQFQVLASVFRVLNTDPSAHSGLNPGLVSTQLPGGS